MIFGSDETPRVAHVLCGTCNGTTPVKRELLAAARLTPQLGTLLATQRSRSGARRTAASLEG